MPYVARGKCVFKKDGGAKVGCTKGNVKKYLAALHANANESEDIKLNEIRKSIRKILFESIKYPIIKLNQEVIDEIKLNEEYGGLGEFKLPNNHKAGITVPKGGSSCASCKFLSKDKLMCTNKFWIEWNGGDSKLPMPADEYCSDWYEPKDKKN